MHPEELTRRSWLTLAPAASLAAASLLNPAIARADEGQRPADEPFGYCLNTSTIRGQKLSLAKEAEIAAKAGFHALEPWISELDDHVKAGGSLEDLGKRIRDLGLTVESAIGFFDWVVDDEARRRKGLEEARRNMELVRRIGGARLAAPPVGATEQRDLDLNRAAERYRALLELGEAMGVVPQVEVWGFSRSLGTLAEAAHVAIASAHPQACILADVYHLYKGGSGFQGLKLLGKNAMHVIHLNDYPASPSRDKINDADRVYPGDGVAPLQQIFWDLNQIGFRGMLSIELFNRSYWEANAERVLETALAKLRVQVKKSFVTPVGG